MKIRKAEKKDIPQIAGLLYQVHALHAKGRPDLFLTGSRKYTDEQLEILLKDERRPVFLCLEKDELLGYLFCVILDEKEPSHVQLRTLYIDDLCVDEGARRKKVGQTLFDFAKDYAKSIGCYNLTLNVWACNPSAHAFYEKMGMTVQKTGMEIVL